MVDWRASRDRGGASLAPRSPAAAAAEPWPCWAAPTPRGAIDEIVADYRAETGMSAYVFRGSSVGADRFGIVTRGALTQ